MVAVASHNVTLSTQQEKAAQLCAADELTDEQIAVEVFVQRRTLWRWRQEPAFASRIQVLREAFRDSAMQAAIFADKRMRIVKRNDVAVDLYTQLKASDYKTVVDLTEDGEPIEAFDKERLRLFDTYLNSIAEEMGDRGGSKQQSISVNVGVAVTLQAEERVGRLASLLARVDAG